MGRDVNLNKGGYHAKNYFIVDGGVGVLVGVVHCVGLHDRGRTVRRKRKAGRSRIAPDDGGGHTKSMPMITAMLKYRIPLRIK